MKTNKNQIKKLLLEAYEHGKNDLWKYNFNKWLKETLEKL